MSEHRYSYVAASDLTASADQGVPDGVYTTLTPADGVVDSHVYAKTKTVSAAVTNQHYNPAYDGCAGVQQGTYDLADGDVCPAAEVYQLADCTSDSVYHSLEPTAASQTPAAASQNQTTVSTKPSFLTIPGLHEHQREERKDDMNGYVDFSTMPHEHVRRSQCVENGANPGEGQSRNVDLTANDLQAYTASRDT